MNPWIEDQGSELQHQTISPEASESEPSVDQERSGILIKTMFKRQCIGMLITVQCSSGLKNLPQQPGTLQGHVPGDGNPVAQIRSAEAEPFSGCTGCS